MPAIRLLSDLLINQIAAGELMEEQADAEAHSAPD
jgi:DNA mismatch repair ATPase MutL